MVGSGTGGGSGGCNCTGGVPSPLQNMKTLGKNQIDKRIIRVRCQAANEGAADSGKSLAREMPTQREESCAGGMLARLS